MTKNMLGPIIIIVVALLWIGAVVWCLLRPADPPQRDWREDYLGKTVRIGDTTGTLVSYRKFNSEATVVIFDSAGKPTNVYVDFGLVVNQHAVPPGPE